jgi:hypothetical protein
MQSAKPRVTVEVVVGAAILLLLFLVGFLLGAL